MLFLKLHPASKNKQVILFHKSHWWKMTRGDIHFMWSQIKRDTIPKPIKVFWKCRAACCSAALELLHNVASCPRHLLRRNILTEHMALVEDYMRRKSALCNPGSSTSASSSQEIPVLLHSLRSQTHMDSDGCAWRRMFAPPPTALLSDHGC